MLHCLCLYFEILLKTEEIKHNKNNQFNVSIDIDRYCCKSKIKERRMKVLTSSFVLKWSSPRQWSPDHLMKHTNACVSRINAPHLTWHLRISNIHKNAERDNRFILYPAACNSLHSHPCPTQYIHRAPISVLKLLSIAMLTCVSR